MHQLDVRKVFPPADFEKISPCRCSGGVVSASSESAKIPFIRGPTCQMYLVAPVRCSWCLADWQLAHRPRGRARYRRLRTLALGLTDISPGVTDTTLGNSGWTCIDPNPSLTVCAPPGLGFPPRPPIPNNGGAPSYTIWAFHNHVYDHRVKFIRPDLYQGQPCQGDEPYTLFAPVNYYECIIPAR